MKYGLTDRERAYLLGQMNKVSRSFALVVPRLEEPLNTYLSTAYIICRVVDNIEDCSQPYTWKETRFAEFHQLLRLQVDASITLAHWNVLDWPGLTKDEAQMMGLDGLMLWQIYARLPEKIRMTICYWVSDMAAGMARISAAMHPETPMNHGVNGDFFINHNGVCLLATRSDYNEYCYFVAGTVGHLITDLTIDYYRLNDHIAQRLRATSEACGRALQKTNIIKDFVRDLRRGVCFLPDQWLKEQSYRPLSLAGASLAWKGKVLADVLDELAQSVDYLLALPYKVAGMRHAALLMMLPAYQTILLAAMRREMLFTAAHEIKISRPQMAQCVSQAHTLVGDNRAIQNHAVSTAGRIMLLLEDNQ